MDKHRKIKVVSLVLFSIWTFVWNIGLHLIKGLYKFYVRNYECIFNLFYLHHVFRSTAFSSFKNYEYFLGGKKLIIPHMKKIQEDVRGRGTEKIYMHDRFIIFKDSNNGRITSYSSSWNWENICGIGTN